MSALQPFKQLIRARCGLQLDGLAEERLNKALQQICRQKKLSGFDAYYRLILKQPDDFDELVSQLTINETYFFREPQQIELLIKRLIPRLLAQAAPQTSLRILSAGCSSGEEPYSLAIALNEAWPEQATQLFTLHAGDLDRQVLEKARKGAYSAFSFRTLAASLRDKYFRSSGKGYLLDETLKQRVCFFELNLLNPKVTDEVGQYDLVFFRNVSIYFDTETRQQIQKNLAQLMKPNGILVLGSSETLANDLGVFQLVEELGQYYFVKGTQLLPQSVSRPVQPAKCTPVTPVVPPESLEVVTLRFEPESQPRLVEDKAEVSRLTQPGASIEQIRQHIIEDDLALAIRLLDQYTPYQSARWSEAALLKAWLSANHKNFTLAHQLVDELLHEDAWQVDALFVKALTYKWQEEYDAAIQVFRKVIYTTPTCWPAHYYLAECLRVQGDLKGAEQIYLTVRRILAGGAAPANGFALLPFQLQAKDILFLTERHLLRLKAALSTDRDKESR